MPTIISNSQAQTLQIAQNLAQTLPKTVIICLYGDLGAGKTVFTKGLALGLGISEQEIKSPTYTFVRQYKKGKINFNHFDFYRIETIDDLMAHELSEIFKQKNVYIIIEWPERIESILPTKRIDIKIEYLSEDKRKITINDQIKTSKTA